MDQTESPKHELQPRGWLQALLDPGPLVADVGRTDLRSLAHGLALLLDGQLGLYLSLVRREQPTSAPWPHPDEDAPAVPEARLLWNVARFVTGDPTPADVGEIAALAVPDPEFRAVAAIIASIIAADRGELDRADTLLTEQADENALIAALVRLHRSTCAAEMGRWADAAALAREVWQDEASGAYAEALRVVAAFNLFLYESRFVRPSERQITQADLPLWSANALLVRSTLDTGIGLGKNLEEQFESTLGDPYQRVTRWRITDPVLAGLTGARLRAESLADWNSRLETRRFLGRYQTLVAEPDDSDTARGALKLLIRAGDSNGMAAAARTFSLNGPLDALADIASDAVVQDWTPLTRNPILELLVHAAPLLDDDQAHRALSRTLDDEVFVQSTPIAARTAESLLRTRDCHDQTTYAERLRALAGAFPQALILQSLRRPVSAIDWERVDADERAEWQQFVADHLGTPTDHGLLAEIAAVSLGSADGAAVEELVHEAFVRSPGIDLIGIMLDNGAQLTDSTWRQALDITIASMRNIAEQAHQGTYGFGGISTSLIAVELLNQHGDADAAAALGEFLADPLVGIDEKTPAIERLAAPNVIVPPEVRKTLEPELPDLAGFTDTFAASPAALRAASLRLALKLGLLDADAALGRVVELLVSVDPYARIQGARTLAQAVDVLDPSAATALTLTLCSDTNAEVRAHAAFALSYRFSADNVPLASTAHAQVRLLLHDPGSRIPLGVIGGLKAAYTSGRTPASDIAVIVTKLSTMHRSRTVRRAASELAEFIEK